MVHFKTVLLSFVIFYMLSVSALALDIQFLDTDQQGQAGGPVSIDVMVQDMGLPVNNTLVYFTTDHGVLIPSSAYTNISGMVSVSLNSTVAGTAHVNASSGSSYNVSNITFSPLSISTLLTVTNDTVTSAGNAANLSFIPQDDFSNVNSSLPVSLSVTIDDQFGTQVHDVDLSVAVGQIALLDANWTNTVISYSSGPSDRAVLLLNSTVAGDIFIHSEAGPASNSSSIKVVPGSPGSMRVSYDDDHTVDTSSLINVILYDHYSNPISDANVTFNVTSPEDTVFNSPVTYNSAFVDHEYVLTDAYGQVSNVFTADRRSGDNIVNISVVNSSLQHNITITGIADGIDQLFLTYAPEHAIANNIDHYTLSGRPVDRFLNPIIPLSSAITEQVRFETNESTLLLPLNSQGSANIEVGPTPYVSSISINATYKDASGYTEFTNSTVLNFTADVLDSLDLYAVPNAVLDNTQNGNHNATITVVALDQWGHSLPYVPINISNTNVTTGTLWMEGGATTNNISAFTNSDGRLYATFTGNISGNTSIVAESEDLVLTTNVSIKDEPFLSISISVSPPSVTSGSLVNVTTVISVEGELPIVRPTASAMLVLDRSGSMDPDYYAGDPLDVVLVMDRSGSMSGTPIADAKTAAKEFMDNLASNSEASLVSFASSSSTDLGLIPLDSYTNLSLAKNAVDSIQDGGSTAMGEGMGDANDQLIYHGRDDSKKAMVVLTDGNTNAGEDQQGDNAIETALDNGIVIYTIGLGNNLDESLLMHIASETGGKYYNAPTSSDLKAIYASIAQDLSDYDMTDVEFGVDGFTPYDHVFSDSLEMDTPLDQDVLLSFEGYDLDTVFNAGTEYGGAAAGECLIQINGDNFTLIPSANMPAYNGKWVDYEYDLTGHLDPVSNTITFYEYRAYLGMSAYDNQGRNIEITWNNYSVASLMETFPLDANPYDLSWDMPNMATYNNTFQIDETINDLKVQLDWENSDNELHLQLTSPSGEVYSIVDDSHGYYAESNTSEYIWIRPVFTTYPDDDMDSVEMGNWTVEVIGFGSGTEDFTITTYIDKKSATQLSSHAFISSFDETRGDRAGLVLYSFEGMELSDTQTSYIPDNSTWVGYFTAQEDGFYTFDVSWDDGSLMDVDLYSGADIIASSSGTSACELSKTLTGGNTYHLDVAKGEGSFTDTRFTIDVETSVLDNIMVGYYDASGDGSTPKYRTLEEGSSWSAEKYANYVGGWPYYLELESNPLNSEMIMCTADDFLDLNAQVWDGSSWGDVEELSHSLGSAPYLDANIDYYTRDFDLKYEQTSGDAILVYMDASMNSSIPMYRVWDGSSWSFASLVDDFNPSGNGSISWVQLASDPDSDELVLAVLDDSGYLYGTVWDGSSWAEFTELSNNASQAGYQCFDVVYEQDSGRAMVSWYDRSGYVKYSIWNGNNKWLPEDTVYTSAEDVYWVKMGGNPNSDEVLLVTQDEHKDVHVTVWDGFSWETPLEVGVNVYESNRRSINVVFEDSSGEGMVVWGDGSYLPKYRTWDGSAWSAQSSALSLGSGYTRWVQLTPVPETDEVFLMTSDGGHDINIQKWNGSSWVYIYEVETSSTRIFECFDMALDDKDNIVEDTPVLWNQWTANAASTFENDTLTHLGNVIDTITADGLTAIDEGLFIANNELSSVEGNSTIVIMSDGLDNAGYHSLLEEAYRARDNNSVIYTVGFGNDVSDVDPMLEEIANMTGGTYYFAPNSSVLKAIFTGIAADITNFSASGTAMNIDIPYNYITPLSVAKTTYVSGSSNSTIGNESFFETPKGPSTGNAEPDPTSLSDRTRLKWYLPNMESGDKWGVWYQLKVDGIGYIPVIMSTSSVTYTDISSEIIDVNIPSSGGTSVGGGFANVSSYILGSLDVEPERPLILVDDTTVIDLTVRDITGNHSAAYVYLYSDVGYFGNCENPINVTVVGSDSVDFSSAVASNAHITAYAYNVNNASDIISATEIIIVRPKGMITIS
ncbi:VWA domain-containing protein [Methanolobus profundi]|uniref:von Willebrand factor type A domain-containing protein n=1 Tax=Methanolobus profundi TaxID=487685 RepID=A0A1I4SS83_9EURY|nr:VWA domain-containing protein [Methanolobus profundi]SFM67324.1 von Willebrand factor type A domain-containing protein [Methanolobus profundi]